MGKRVFLYVQHLLGIGHLKRAATLAQALTAAGLEVTVATGGVPVPGLAFDVARVVQLPPASAADLSFTAIVDEHGQPIDAAWKQRRRDLLLSAWRAADPHALLIELFPFGRRQMRFELLPLLDAAAAPDSMRRPVIACSVRDVLGGGQKNPARQDEMLALFERYFDHLLVHGDPTLIPFGRTFRHAGRIAGRLHYTGYVVDRPRARSLDDGAGVDEVLVSAGGGAVGQRLFETAIRARPLSSLAARTWRLLAGVNVSPAQFDALALAAERAEPAPAAAGARRVVVERARADFTTLLANCMVSISQGGYNTLMETLQAGARAVVVPFAGGAEIEQGLRARLLQERGMLDVVEEAALTPALLAAAVDRAASHPGGAAASAGVDLGGAERSAALLARWTEDRTW